MALLSNSAIWNEIDLSESYLVCCMFEEAASLASSVVHRVHSTPFADAIDDVQLAEMMVAAGMVFVQSMKELGRTQELFVELRTLFGSAAAIPVKVFLTGACMQISQRFTSNLRAIFEEFLGKWKYVDGEIYVLTEAEPQSSSDKRGMKQSVMDTEKYLEIAEVYTITVLGMVLSNPNLAISWTEKAELPEENRQILLRRLHSFLSAKNSSSHSDLGGVQKPEQMHSLSSSGSGSTRTGDEAYPKVIKQELHANGEMPKAGSLKTAHPCLRNILDQISCCFWWFRTVRLKFGNIQLVLPGGKQMLLGSLIVLTYYILRQKSKILKRLVARQASGIKRALVDAWQLAFSVQVNPLAAIQQLPSAPHGIM